MALTVCGKNNLICGILYTTGIIIFGTSMGFGARAWGWRIIMKRMREAKEMAQWEELLLSKQKDPSSDLQLICKSHEWWCMSGIPELEGRDRRILGTHWLASPGKRTPGSVRGLVSMKKEVRDKWRKILHIDVWPPHTKRKRRGKILFGQGVRETNSLILA